PSTRMGMDSAPLDPTRATALPRPASARPLRALRTHRAPKLTPGELHFRLLGTPEIQVAGAPLILHNQKAQALLYYLAVTQHPHPRHPLAPLRWSGSPDSTARHSLRTSLYHLRQALQSCGASARLTVQKNLVHLGLRENECDVARFDSLAAAGQETMLREAVALYRGPLLEGLSLADAPVFED